MFLADLGVATWMFNDDLVIFCVELVITSYIEVSSFNINGATVVSSKNDQNLSKNVKILKISSI